MSTNLIHQRGKSFPLGATLIPGGANFSVFVLTCNIGRGQHARSCDEVRWHISDPNQCLSLSHEQKCASLPNRSLARIRS